MNERGLTQKNAVPATHRVPSGLLQRQCACGNHTVAGGECEECRQKREGMLQRSAANAAPVNEVPSIVYEVLRSPGQPLDPETRAFMEPRFGCNLSRISTHFPAIEAIQTKLAINKPGDEYEQEADHIADQVLAAPPVPPAVSGAPPHFQRFLGQPSGQAEAAALASIDRVLASPGRPLDPVLGQEMEQRFRYDFTNVRVHVDNCAANSAAALGANAYTLGQHIVFGWGKFDPTSIPGRRLIAHELAHTIQQRGSSNKPLGKAPAREQEADHAASQVLDNSVVPTLTPSGIAVACQLSGEIPQNRERICVPGLASDDPACVEWIKREEQLKQSEKKRSLSIAIAAPGLPLPVGIGLQVPAHPDAVSGIHEWTSVYGTPGQATSHNKFDISTFRLLQVCTFDETGAARVYVYYAYDTDSDDKYAVGPDALLRFVMLHGGRITPHGRNTDQLESGRSMVDPRKLPAAPDAFKQLTIYYAAPQLPRYDAQGETFHIGKYSMAAYLRRLPNGNMAVLYYIARNILSEHRPEYVVGPAWLNVFTERQGGYALIAEFSYPLEPGAMPPAYAVHSARFVQGVMHGDPERASEGLEAWKSAAKDPSWWFQVAMSYAGAAQPRPPVGTPSLRVLPGRGAVPVAIVEPIGTVPASVSGSVARTRAATAAAIDLAPASPPIARPVPTPVPMARPRPQGVPGWNPNPAPVAPRVSPPPPIITATMIGALSKVGEVFGTGVQPAPAVAADVSAATTKRRSPGAYPIFWPTVFGPPMLFNTPIVLFVRTPNRERDWDYSVEVRRELWARHRGMDPDLMPSDFHAHHIVPLFLGGLEGARGNITFLPGRIHLSGHGLLADQPQMAFPPPPLRPLPRNIYQHPINTLYELVGFK